MPNRRPAFLSVLTIIAALLVVTIALPERAKGWAPAFLRTAALHYGLDLVGGTQLDFRISEQEMQAQADRLRQEISERESADADAAVIAALQYQLAGIEEQQQIVVEAIRTVLERRINALGVSEAVITPSYIGNEKHLLVECPGIVDTQKCIDTVGKTITLEFKEEETEPTEEHEQTMRGAAAQALLRITESGETLAVVGEDLSDDLGVSYIAEQAYFADELPEGLGNLMNGKVTGNVLLREGSITARRQNPDETTEDVQVPGMFLIEVLKGKEPRERVVQEAARAFALAAEREEGVSYASFTDRELAAPIDPAVSAKLRSQPAGELSQIALGDGTARVLFLRSFTQGREEVGVSHILLSYADAPSPLEGVTRSREEALALINTIKERLARGESFEKIARASSDGPSARAGGALGRKTRAELAPSFAEIAFKTPEGEIAGPVETPFGYHLVRVDSAPARTPDRATFEDLTVTGENAPLRATEIAGRLQRGDVKATEDSVTLRGLFFSFLPTGWKDTLLDGKHFRSATVTMNDVTNVPIVRISFDEEGGRLFQELTKKNVGKRIAIFVGGELVTAPVVQQEIVGGNAEISGSQTFEKAKTLAQDLNTGAMPAPIYLAGQRTVEATLGAHALQASLKAALVGTILVMTYMIVFYRVLGLLASFALAVYALLFFAVLKLPLFLFSHQYFVLTLAGMAGIILSIGMAVDANVLIFERIKEELRKGKMFRTAAEIGFERAWPSIRDGNASTLITCAILFLVGTSIVRGFAIALSIGILMSMFTAIVITRWLVRRIGDSPLAENAAAFGVKRE